MKKYFYPFFWFFFGITNLNCVVAAADFKDTPPPAHERSVLVSLTPRESVVEIEHTSTPSTSLIPIGPDLLRQYQEGMRSIGNVHDIAGWEAAIGRLRTYGWHVKASDSLLYGHDEWRTEIDADRLRKVFESLCGTVISIATAVGSADAISSVISKAVECFTSALKSDGDDESTLTFTQSSGKEMAIRHGVVEGSQHRHVAGYFLSFERTADTSVSFIHKSASTGVKCDGKIVLFELHPRLPAPTPQPIPSRYNWLPDGCTTNVYVALIDHHFPSIHTLFKKDGDAGWCQIVDTRDDVGDIVYSIRHYVRNEPGKPYSLWTSQKARAVIEILIGSKYPELAKLGEMGEVKTLEIHSSIKPIMLIDDRFAERNRHKYWMNSAIVGMQMPAALTCSGVIETIKSMIKTPTNRQGEDPLEYCLYGCRWFSKAINCIPWPFMFWERTLGRRVCSESMGEYIDFKKWTSPCTIEDGYYGFFNKSGNLVEPRMKLVQSSTGANKHRIWVKPGREGTVEMVGGIVDAYGSFDWNKKLKGRKIEVMDITHKNTECFVG